jgi:hypothetical protein
MATNINYAVNVTLYSKINVNQNEKDKEGKPLSPNVETAINGKLSLSIKATAPITAGQLKTEVKKQIKILQDSEEVVTFKGRVLSDSEIVSDVVVSYDATANLSGVTTTTTTIAPTTSTTTVARTTSTTTLPI